MSYHYWEVNNIATKNSETCTLIPVPDVGTTSTFNLLGELDPVGVCEGAWLLIDVVDVQDLTHELDDGLGLVEGCGRHCRRRRGERRQQTEKKRRWTTEDCSQVRGQILEFG